jgi:RNA polymerase sigma-70 factor (ECF subfamily)
LLLVPSPRAAVVIRPSAPPDPAFDALLAQARQFLLALANAELPAALRAKGGASDLVQEAFAAALRNRDQFRGTTLAELRAWLRAILRNELATLRRRFAAGAREVGRELAVGAAGGLAGPMPPAVEQMIRDERDGALAAGVAGLPDDLRQAVVLRVGEGLPFSAIGERLGRSEEAARKLFGRALDRLRGAVPQPAD